jgi:uncharacterized membrane protein YciS (DUF1049 family)
MRLIILLFIIFLTITISASNTQQTNIMFLSGDYAINISVGNIMIGCFLLGVLIGLIAAIIHYHKKTWQLKQQLKQTELEKFSLQQQVASINAQKVAQSQLQ